MNGIKLIGEIRSLSGSEQDTKDALERVIKPALKASKCLDYQIEQSNLDPRLFLVVENWATETDMEQHFSSPEVIACGLKLSPLLEKMEFHAINSLY
ncbi:MAG: putative quinol monooxygenase [bacterium]